ncbi:dehydrogenase [Rhizobium rhizosphaerae]|uniref:Pyridine nucleotide-disulfide oxidoreductase domain-containing protein 2 n=1 Tax=Xaviernesmea rhizosphaerae TaxID=1672749 RepID=A0ABX3PH90_9HYPH|nr:NAD(P)/FAD-dependent oxidoreductase [Xaviernesmea rhizosphaerae]OQP87511.1 dehydrogenase [Xaviernesmea rhizosphaerae]
MSNYDAVVIGAGHNGLAAAIHLASRGWSVAVVEARDVAGGAVKTAELIEPGFRHDLCAMNLSMFAGSAFHKTYGPALAAHGLGFVPAADSFASLFRDGSHLGVGTDRAKTRAAIAALSADDAEAWDRMSDGFGAFAPPLFGILGAPMPSFAGARALWQALRAGGLARLYDLGQLLLSSPRSFLDRHFKSEKLKSMMAAWGLHLDFAPDTAGGALFPYLETMATQAFGMVIGAGGADSMIRAMTGLLREKGGTLHLGAPVSEIVMEGGRATGVGLADGRQLTARRAVIANLHPRLVFDRLLPAAAPIPARYREGIRRYRAGPGAMMIHLTLDGLPDWRGAPELSRYAYVHLAPDLAMMNRVYAEAIAGLLPAEPVLVVGQPTAIDPSRAPEGKHVLWVQVRVLPAVIKGDAAGIIAATDWAEAREAYADRVMALIETYAPGLSAKIRGRLVVSPADLERENPCLIGGDSLGGSHQLDQNFLFRPVAGWSRYRTPVDGLHLCGAATWPGAGTGAGSGFLLARMLAG